MWLNSSLSPDWLTGENRDDILGDEGMQALRWERTQRVEEFCEIEFATIVISGEFATIVISGQIRNREEAVMFYLNILPQHSMRGDRYSRERPSQYRLYLG
jgi:hypothetical protein